MILSSTNITATKEMWDYCVGRHLTVPKHDPLRSATTSRSRISLPTGELNKSSILSIGKPNSVVRIPRTYKSLSRLRQHYRVFPDLCKRIRSYIESRNRIRALGCSYIYVHFVISEANIHWCMTDSEGNLRIGIGATSARIGGTKIVPQSAARRSDASAIMGWGLGEFQWLTGK